MSETLVSYGCVLSEIASAPSSHSEGGALLPRRRCSATRLPPRERPVGFAPPPRDGFALLASAHGCACLSALLPMGDAFAMNIEAVSVSISVLLLFSETFFVLGAKFAEKVAAPSAGT